MNKNLTFTPDRNIDQTNYYWFADAFSSEEVQLIDQLQNMYPFVKDFFNYSFSILYEVQNNYTMYQDW